MSTEQTPPKPSLWKPLLLWFFVSLVGEIAGYLLSSVLGLQYLHQGSHEIVPSVLIVQHTFASLVTLGTLFLFLRKSQGGILQRLGFIPSGLSWKQQIVFLLAGVFVFFVSIGLSTLYVSQFDWKPTWTIPYEEIHGATAISFVLFIAFVPGFGEEILFRGFLQKALQARLRPAAAIAISSLIFALAHGAMPRILLALPFGIWLGIVFWRTGSIWPGIVCHALINGGWNVVMLFTHAHSYENLGIVDVVLVLVLLAVSLLGFLDALKLLRRKAADPSLVANP